MSTEPPHLAAVTDELELVAPAPETIHRLYAEPIDNPRGPDILQFDVTGDTPDEHDSDQFISIDELNNPNADSIHLRFRAEYLLSTIAKLAPAAYMQVAHEIDEHGFLSQ